MDHYIDELVSTASSRGFGALASALEKHLREYNEKVARRSRVPAARMVALAAEADRWLLAQDAAPEDIKKIIE